MKTKTLPAIAAFLVAVAAGHAQTTFMQVTNGDIVTDPGQFTRGVWGDFNNDGYLDLFVCNYGTNVLYYNNRDGTFIKVTQGDPVMDLDFHTGAAAADFDNDGNLDLLVSAGMEDAGVGTSYNTLYQGTPFPLPQESNLFACVGNFDFCSCETYVKDFLGQSGPLPRDPRVVQAFSAGQGRTAYLSSPTIGNAIFAISNGGVIDGPIYSPEPSCGGGNLFSPVNNILFPSPQLNDYYACLNGGISSCEDFVRDFLSQAGLLLPDPLVLKASSFGAGRSTYLSSLTVQDVITAISQGYRVYGPIGGGFTNLPGNFDACSWADYDNDGFVDFFIISDRTNNSGANNLLFHNNGDGTFRQVISTGAFINGQVFFSSAIINDIGVGRGALWSDYDNDGFMDLIVVNLSPTNNFLYHNNRDGTFTRVLTNAIVTDSWPLGAQGGAWGDYDNDGMPDLFVTDNGGVRNHLYHNNGSGCFTNVASGPELESLSTGGSFGCSWGDYDNDGYLDLFVCGNNGVNGLYHNNGDGTFTQITNEPPVNGGGPDFVCHSVAWADYDNDGFLDLFLTRSSELTDVPNLLYHNVGNANGWLEVKLVGTVANRSAIGAKVRVKATIHGKTFWQLREITGGGGWNLQPLAAHFGLGDATNIDTLRIEWPSGTVQEFHNITPKQILPPFYEPPRLMASVTNGVPQFSLKGGRGFQYEIDSSPDLTIWSPIGTVTITNLNGMVSIIDPNPPASSQRFYRAVSYQAGQ